MSRSIPRIGAEPWKSGVNYLCTVFCYGGMTVLLDTYGKPVITSVSTLEDL